MRNRNGFSLLEILLVVAMFGILAAFISPAAHTSYLANNLRSAHASIRNALSLARAYALCQKNNSSWGVYITTTTITVFAGKNFSSRTPAYDEIIDIPGGITTTGINDIIFNSLSAKPTTTGTIQLDIDTGQSLSISINEEGAF
jgi:prepilin-type N-terminal cleavage/methylation domain-containing protein